MCCREVFDFGGQGVVLGLFQMQVVEVFGLGIFEGVNNRGQGEIYYKWNRVRRKNYVRVNI